MGGSASANRLQAAVHRLGRYGVFESETSTDLANIGLAQSVSLIPRVINPQTGDFNKELSVSFKLSQASNVVAKILKGELP